MRGIKGDTRSLDYSSYHKNKGCKFGGRGCPSSSASLASGSKWSTDWLRDNTLQGVVFVSR